MEDARDGSRDIYIQQITTFKRENKLAERWKIALISTVVEESYGDVFVQNMIATTTMPAIYSMHAGVNCSG